MTTWILALLFLSCSAVAGYCFGIVRTTASLVGLLLGAVLAFPLGHYLNPVLGWFGLKNPVLLWAAGPVCVVILVFLILKGVGLLLNHKVEIYYKYKAGDLQTGLWKRLNIRVGLCLGLINGAVYVILLSPLICIPSYATNQLVIGDNGNWKYKTFNLLGRDAHASGLDKIAAGLDPMPADYYLAADIVGLVYHNDLLEARVARYSAFFTLAERPEFQTLGTDKAYLELRQRQPAFSEILENPVAAAIVDNPDELREIWGIIQPDLQDFATFLRTGQSAKYGGEKILGRWSFNVNAALEIRKQAEPDLRPVQMQRLKDTIRLAFSKTTLVAAPTGEIYIKDYGSVTFPAPPAATFPATPVAAPVTPPGGPRPAPGGARGGQTAGGRGGAQPAGGRNGGTRGAPVQTAARGPAPVPSRGPVARPGTPPAPPTVEFQKLEGRWTHSGDSYQITISGRPGWKADIDGDKLTIEGDKLPLRFDRDY